MLGHQEKKFHAHDPPPSLPCVCAALAASAQQSAISRYPAGRTLQAWLDAFNSGDRTKIENYVKTSGRTQNADTMIGFRGHTGGFDLLSGESSERLQIRFVMKRKSDTRAIGSLLVHDGNPPTHSLVIEGTKS